MSWLSPDSIGIFENLDVAAVVVLVFAAREDVVTCSLVVTLQVFQKDQLAFDLAGGDCGGEFVLCCARMGHVAIIIGSVGGGGQ